MAEPEKKKEEGEESEEKEEVPPPPPPEPEKLGEFSVWAMPNHYDPTLHLAMTQLKETYEGPEFEPHVTVMGAYTALPSQAEKCLKELCASILPFTLKIKKVGCGNTFHQCVYLLMDPTEELVNAHIKALGCFGQLMEGSDPTKQRESYMPHMSLLYANMSDEDLDLAKAKVEAEHGKLLIGKEYKVTHLTLYLTDVADESCKSWKKIAEFPLREPDKPSWAE